MVVTCRQMQEIEETAFSRGVSAEELMEQAGSGIAAVVQQFFPEPGHLVLYPGKGNNGGDAFVAARHLVAAGWQVHVRASCEISEFRPLPAKHWNTLKDQVTVVNSAAAISRLRGRVILMDGLVGIGAKGGLRGRLADAALEINHLKRQRHAQVVALDLPSGLDSETGEPGSPCVEADLTIAIAHTKTALLQDAATRCVGRLAVVPLPDLDAVEGGGGRRLLTSQVLLPILPRRSFDFHKGQAGRVGIIAGSRGYFGAAVLACTGALRAGAGLVTLHVREADYSLMASMAPPEIMVKPVKDYRSILEERLDALAIGSGLGSDHQVEVLTVIREAKCPTVLDADALNLLARTGLESLKEGPAPRLLTPHPGEMERLATQHPAWRQMSRSETVIDFVRQYPDTTLLLKGSRTVIAGASRAVSYNSTGNPGMATGGMGDTLTGVCAALSASGLALYDAACLGAWVCGRAAELAVAEGDSEEALLPSGVASHLGAAFRNLRTLPY